MATLVITAMDCVSAPVFALQADAMDRPAAGAVLTSEPGLSRPNQGNGVTLDQAVEQVRRQYPGGKIVSAETRGKSHVIKVLTADGTVRTIRIPAG